MHSLQRFCLGLAGLMVVLLAIGWFASIGLLWKTSLLLGAAALAVGIGSVPSLAGYQFTVWIVAAILAGMLSPATFLNVGGFDTRNPRLILIIVQLVMFGMGTKMSLRDFAGVTKNKYPIVIGIGLQFLIMPLTGYLLAKAFQFPDEIAAGVVLIGSCSSGLASNVMCYLAGANLALSISLTAIATLLAPLATPFWMKQLAGEFVEVDAVAMALNIVKIVLVPIGAAMLHDFLKTASSDLKRLTLWTSATLALLLLGVGFFAPVGTMAKENCVIFGAAIWFAILYHWAVERQPAIERYTHVLSMFGIIYFTLVTTAAGRDNLLTAGLALVAAAMLHNLAGYSFGYGLSRLAGLDNRSALTVAFEVGMQNGGMASGLAGLMNKLATLGLAAAVFSPWMNISGSVLANLVKRYNLCANPSDESG